MQSRARHMETLINAVGTDCLLPGCGKLSAGLSASKALISNGQCQCLITRRSSALAGSGAVEQDDGNILVFYYPKKYRSQIDSDLKFLEHEWMKKNFACKFTLRDEKLMLDQNFCFAATDGLFLQTIDARGSMTVQRQDFLRCGEVCGPRRPSGRLGNACLRFHYDCQLRCERRLIWDIAFCGQLSHYRSVFANDVFQNRGLRWTRASLSKR